MRARGVPRRSPVTVALAAMAAILLSASAARGQSATATLSGTVSDQTGGVVPGVSILLVNADTALRREATTTEEGYFALRLLPPGRYTLRAHLEGFAPVTIENIVLSVHDELVMSVSLRVAGIEEMTTVTATPPVQISTATVQAPMGRTQLELLPLAGRDYETLLRLAPGAQDNNGIAFSGSRGRSNTFLIDGVENSNDITGYSLVGPTVDSVQEYRVLINNFKAEFGRGTGGIVSVVTRSGTNQLRGSGLFLFQDETLASRGPFAERFEPDGSPRRDPFERRHYGVTLGGPVVRDRAHYFLSYEHVNLDDTSSATVTLPVATAAFSAATLQFLSSQRIDLALFGTGGRRRLVRPEFANTDRVTVRLDHQLRPTQSLAVRHLFSRRAVKSGEGTTLLDLQGRTIVERDNFATVRYNWIASSNKVNELSVQIGQRRYELSPYFKMPRVNVTGAFSLGLANALEARTDYVVQMIDTFSWQLQGTRSGDHFIKAGADVKTFRSDSIFDANFHGTFTFPSLARFLDGRPSSFTQRQGNSQLKRPNEIYAFFVQDDWRPNPGLMLSLGLRYDRETARTEALREVTGEPGPGISRDRNNFGPRAGFVWTPRGSTTQAVYGGAGIYYDQIILNIQGNARFTPPKVISVRIDNPPFPDPFAGLVTVPPAEIQFPDPNLVTPWSMLATVGYRRQLTSNLGVDVSVVHRREWDQILQNDRNAGLPGTATLTGTGRIRPDPTADGIQVFENAGWNRYTALLIEVRRQLSRGVQGAVNYTLSKATDNGERFTSSFQVPTQPGLNVGPGNDDRRHRIAGHAQVELPWDVQLGAIVEFRSEAPLDITAARDLNGDGITGDWVNEALCANLACPGFGFSRNSVRQLSTEEANLLRALFGLSAIERFENNPKFFNADVSIQKGVRLGRYRARVRLDAFNLFNLSQHTQPTTSITSSLFGQYTNVVQPRALQLAFHFDW